LYGRLMLVRFHPLGYYFPSVQIAHTKFSAGKQCYLGERVLIFEDREGLEVQIGDGVHMHRDTTIQTGHGGSVVIGDGTSIQPRCQFSAYRGSIRIGQRVEIAPNCAFYPYNHGMDIDIPITKQPTYTTTGISVGDDAWLGVGVVLLDGAQIGNGAVVAAGAVVNSDIPDNAIAAGIPARIVGQRTSSEHGTDK